jgi:hypothetical protein
MVISGSFDCVLSTVCLAIFLRAEVERCCICEKTSLNRVLELSYGNNDSCDPYHPCCPDFGNRLCGGVGKLEPIASIIAFRVMRFYIAKKLWRSLSKLGEDSRGVKNGEDELSNSQELMVEFTSKKREKAKDKLSCTQHVNFEHDTGTIAKLWSSALLKYPKIVSDYGMFSGKLLEAMLGIEYSAQINNTVCQSEDTQLMQASNKLVDNLHSAPSASRWKSMVDRHANRSNSEILSSVGDDWNEETEYNFIRPEAPLIRKMRRCQCKWLPLLDEWQVVDVVLTNYEIVWMEPKSFVEICDKATDLKKQYKGQNLEVDNGGRGMSLCDAVKGRKVIGRLPTSDIFHVKVQRFPPAESHPLISDVNRDLDVETALDAHDFAYEYWEEMNFSSKNARSLGKAHERFLRVIEDNLVLQSLHGTLYLRFLVDLVEEEKAMDGHGTIDLNSLKWREGALLWCQTIAHLCGPQQLKQKLHHMGEERDKELLDFLEVCDKKKSELSFRLIGRH